MNTRAEREGTLAVRSSASLASCLQLMRLHALGGTAHWPLLAWAAFGAAAESRWKVFGALLGICFCFNWFGYLMNDLADEEVDQFDPARQHHPLHSGALSRTTLTYLMWWQLPVLVVLHVWAGFSVVSAALLLLSLLLLALYNRFSKLCRVPLLMDGVLGLSALGLTLFGATCVDGVWRGHLPSLQAAVLLFALGSAVCLMMINAFHNNLRDLPYENSSPRFTTAKLLGAYLDAQGAPVMGKTLASYGAALQGVLVLVSIQMCVELEVTALVLALVIGANTLSIGLFAGMIACRGFVWQRVAGVHLLAFPLPLMLPWLASIESDIAGAVVGVYLLPPLFLLFNRPAWRIGQIDAFVSSTNRPNPTS